MQPEQTQTVDATEQAVVLRASWFARAAIPVGFALVTLFVAALLFELRIPALPPQVALAPAFVGLVWTLMVLRRRAVIGPDMIEVREILTRRVRFETVERITWDARRYRFYLFIPLGRVAKLGLRGPDGSVLFHNGFSRFDAHAQKVLQRAIEALVRRWRERIGRAERVRIGRRIEVDHQALYLRSLVGAQQRIPLPDLHIDVADGTYTLLDGDRPVARFSAARTPNLLALPRLVDELVANRDRPRPSMLAEALRLGAQA